MSPNLEALMNSPMIENKLIAFEMIRNTEVEAAFELSKEIAKILARDMAKDTEILPFDMVIRTIQLSHATGIFPHLVFDRFKEPLLLRSDLFDMFMQMKIYNPINIS